MKRDYKEPVLDIKEFIWEVLSQWKAILLVALIMGLTMTALKHASAMKQYEAQQNNKNEVVAEFTSMEEKVDNILLALNDSDRAAVINGLKQRESIIASSKYVQSSILMNMNLFNERVINIGFSISGDQENLKELFKGYVYSFDEQGLQSLGKALGYDTEPEYIKELINVDYEKTKYVDDYETIVFQIAAPEEADINMIKDAVVQIIQNRCSALTKTVAPHTIKLVYCDEFSNVDYTSLSLRYDTIARMNSLQSNLKNAISTMSVEQSAAYNQIIGIISADTEIEKQIDADSNQEITAPGYSKKYVVVGFAMGAMMYIVLLLLYMLFSGRILTGDSAAYYSESRLIGSIYNPVTRKGLSKLFHSKIIDKFRFRDTNPDNQIDKAIASLGAIRDHYELDRISVIKLDDQATEAENQIVTTIVEKAKSKDLNIEILEATNADGTINEDVVQAENRVVISLVGDHIKNRKLRSLVELLKYYEVNVEGIVFGRDL